MRYRIVEKEGYHHRFKFYYVQKRRWPWSPWNDVNVELSLEAAKQQIEADIEKQKRIDKLKKEAKIVWIQKG